jgi:hypothetical protein
VVAEKRLVFANLAGGVAASLGYDEAAQMIDAGLARPLATGSVFTRCLAQAATVETMPDRHATTAEAAPATDDEPHAARHGHISGARIMPFPEPELTVDPHAIPIGTWLGFHDGEIPLLARLAVHDPTQDSYIFVNRDGVKLRELSGGELQRLFDDEVVDVLELRAPPRSRPAGEPSEDDQEERA